MFAARPLRYSASAVCRRAASSTHGTPPGNTRFPSTIAYGRRGAASTPDTVTGAARAIRKTFAPVTYARPSSTTAASHLSARGRGGAGGASGIPVDLGRPHVAVPVPADVLARQVEENLLVRHARRDRARDPLEDDLPRVGRMKQERLPEHDGLAVPHDTRLEKIAGRHPERLAPFAHRETRAADQVLDVQHLARDLEQLEHAVVARRQRGQRPPFIGGPRRGFLDRARDRRQPDARE